jgi:3-isopropylmalate dehydrogenase
MAVSIAVLPGDGIGPEITAPTLEVLSRLGDFAFAEHPFGGGERDAWRSPRTAPR